MGDLGIHIWTGQSGQKYRYTFYMFGTVFGPGPANFILARESRPGQYLPIYIRTDRRPFRAIQRPDRARLPEAESRHHIHVRHSDARDEVRRAERSDLISIWNPPCNPMR